MPVTTAPPAPLSRAPGRKGEKAAAAREVSWSPLIGGHRDGRAANHGPARPRASTPARQRVMGTGAREASRVATKP
jgi:hypothetical protein